MAFGITGFWVPFILFMNAQGLGIAAGLFLATGKMDIFFSYILPHGLMELTAVFMLARRGSRFSGPWCGRAHGQGCRLWPMKAVR